MSNSLSTLILVVPVLAGLAATGCHDSKQPTTTSPPVVHPPSSVSSGTPALAEPTTFPLSNSERETSDDTANRIFNEQCVACHNIGKVGKPQNSVPLDHVGKYRTVASIELKIRHPDKDNPDTGMPLFPPDRIKEGELHDLANFLERQK